MSVVLSPGQASDTKYFREALDAISVQQKRGAPRKRPKTVIADRGYDSDEHRRWCRSQGFRAMIPERKYSEKRKRRKLGAPRFFDKELYKQRNHIERLFNRLKECRRLISRFEKIKDNFLTMIHLAFIRFYLKSYLSNRT